MGFRGGSLLGGQFFTIVLLFAGCHRTPESNSPLRCDEPIINVGVISDTSVTREFVLNNVSGRTVEIHSVQKSCTCLAPTLSTNVVEPGEELRIVLQAELNATRPSPFHHYLLLDIGDSNPIPLAVRGTYQPRAHIEEEFIRLEWSPLASREIATNVTMWFRNDKHYQARQETLPIDDYTLQFEGTDWLAATRSSQAPRDRWGIRKDTIVISGVVPDDAALPLYGWMVVRWGDEKEDSKRYPIVLATQFDDAIRFQPAQIALGILAPEETQNFEVTGHWDTRSQYQITSVDCGGRIDFDHTTSHENGNTYLAICGKFTAPSATGAIAETLQIELTNSVQTRVVTIPISGWIE